MKKGLIAFATLALATVALVSCGGGKELDSLTITNKDELQAVWHANDGNVREINLQVKPDGKININKEVSNGNLTIESSASDVVSANGLNLTALKEGTSTVSVKYKKVLYDSVALTIAAEENCITLYGTTHAGTEADPLTAADACIVAGKVGTTATPKAWVVKDVVYGIKSAYDPSFGNLSVFIGDKTNSFLVYRLAVTSETQVEVNDTITIKTAIYNYNGNTPETSGNIELLDVTKGEPAKDPDPIKDAKTVHAGTLADPFDGADALKFCKYIGETTSISKYFIKDVAATASISTSYGNADVDITVGEEKFTLYRFNDVGGEKFTDASKFIVGDTITVKASISQYVHTDKTVDYRGVSGELVKVEKAPEVDPTAVAFKDGESLEMNLNTGKQLELTWTPLNAKKDATWTSDNTEVASVDAGFVSCLGVGEANITVTSTAVNTVTASIKVIVVDVDAPVKFETNLVAEQEYYGGVYSKGLGKTLLAIPELNGNYAKTTEKLSEAKKVVLYEVTGGYNIKVGDKFLNGVVSSNQKYFNIQFGATATTVWSWDATLKTFTTKANTIVSPKTEASEHTYFIGSRNTFDTLGCYTIEMLSGEEANNYYAFGVMLPSSFSSEATALSIDGVAEVEVGAQITLTGIVRPHYLNLEVTEWKSHATAKATVDKNGVVTGVEEGEAEIELRANGFSASKTIKIKKADESKAVLELDGKPMVGYTFVGTKEQSVVQKGVTLTNKKGDSTTNTYDCTNTGHLRCYKSSNISIDAGTKKIAKIVFTCTATDMVLQGTFDGISLTTKDVVVTATVASPAAIINFNKLGGQARLLKVEIFFQAEK